MQHVTQLEQQVASGVGLGQAAIHVERGDLGRVGIVSATGGDDDFEPRLNLAQRAHEHQSVHAGHGEIGHHDGDVAHLPGEKGERGGAVLGDEHFVTVTR